MFDQPEAKLEQLIRHVVTVGTHARHRPGIRQGLSAHARATLGQYEDALDRHIRDVLEQGQHTGAFRTDLSPVIDTRLVRHMLDGVAELAASQPEDAAALVTAGTRTVIAAVAAG